MSLVLNIPEPGQLVDVRQRRYVVVDVIQGALPPDLLKLDGLNQHNGSQHLISLASVEDDDLGEELQVIWEVRSAKLSINALPIHSLDYFLSP